jgi:hypothetical protein
LKGQLCQEHPFSGVQSINPQARLGFNYDVMGADSDMNLAKRVFTRESTSLQIGAFAFNVFNHPNFQLPASDVANTAGLGNITGVAAPPTSPYGSFQGAGVGGRVVQVYGKFTF